MTGFAIALLFGAALIAAAATLYASIRPQLPRFAVLFRLAPASVLPPLAPRLGRVTVRSVPARLTARQPLRAAA
ncbi:hypothetical protein FHS95_000228 [Sphingomonas naasensis]|uniref:Uncharacterized protein n=1 Tax=Sphingomonas naasensis TaxID=1344951 RepID=A0A4S1WR28_9SPHN|nr:hypothetical protein [Sphingomonas naasensis]NIJ18559.1 hypothetical protein [Sphingomonas naasensis]TGX45809.1 hypothetical protein E5A74_01105 [Sphingomonas naasensis]